MASIDLPNELRFELGGIISIKSYEYEDGGEPTDKILIVLHKGKTNNVTFLTFTLTTSQLDKNQISKLFRFEGCVKTEEDPHLHFYYFKKNKIVGRDDNFAFDVETVILINSSNIRHREISHFEKYSSKDHKFVVRDVMNKEQLTALLECILNSEHITPDIEALLNESLESLA